MFALRAKSGITNVNPTQLQPGPIRHGELSAELVKRVELFLPIFQDVDPSSKEKWLEDFRRDLNPENEIVIWEAIASALNQFVANEKPDLALKQEAFGLLLARSASETDAAIASKPLKHMTLAQAHALLDLYTAPPQPIQVLAN